MSLYTQPYDFCIPPDDGPEIFLSDVEAMVDSGEFCDRPEMGIHDSAWVYSGADTFFDCLASKYEKAPGSAAAICRAMRGLDPRPGDLEAMDSLFKMMRDELIAACKQTLCAEAAKDSY